MKTTNTPKQLFGGASPPLAKSKHIKGCYRFYNREDGEFMAGLKSPLVQHQLNGLHPIQSKPKQAKRNMTKQRSKYAVDRKA